MDPFGQELRPQPERLSPAGTAQVKIKAAIQVPYAQQRNAARAPHPPAPGTAAHQSLEALGDLTTGTAWHRTGRTRDIDSGEPGASAGQPRGAATAACTPCKAKTWYSQGGSSLKVGPVPVEKH